MNVVFHLFSLSGMHMEQLQHTSRQEKDGDQIISSFVPLNSTARHSFTRQLGNNHWTLGISYAWYCTDSRTVEQTWYTKWRAYLVPVEVKKGRRLFPPLFLSTKICPLVPYSSHHHNPPETLCSRNRARGHSHPVRYLRYKSDSNQG